MVNEVQWFGSAPCWRRLKKTCLFPLLMELMRGVCPLRSSSRLSPRARHSSTWAAVVAEKKLRELDDDDDDDDGDGGEE